MALFGVPKNANYAAVVVRLKDFVNLPNCDRLKAALIFSNSVIVSKDLSCGEIGLFFPVECELSKAFLANNNLYRKPEWGNVDPAQTGFFEASGRVKAVKFRGNKSEGFWIPLAALAFTGIDVGQLREGDTFDQIGDVEICRKYFPKGYGVSRGGQARANEARLEDSIVAGQFRFHFDTANLRRNLDKIFPMDLVSVSDKWHGTSIVVGKLLVKRRLNLLERFLRTVGVAIRDSDYGLVYSSRRVIKAVNGVTKANEHFYSEDIWGGVARSVQDRIPHGFTIYGEIVGYTSTGEAIQRDYAYGCAPGTHRLIVYRATVTTEEGRTIELSWPQLGEFCSKYGFERPPTLYYGTARDLAPTAVLALGLERWRADLLRHLEQTYVSDADCSYNAKGTPAEGVVLRVDGLEECRSYKLKNFRFLERESKLLDTGEVDTETAQSVEELPADEGAAHA